MARAVRQPASSPGRGPFSAPALTPARGHLSDTSSNQEGADRFTKEACPMHKIITRKEQRRMKRRSFLKAAGGGAAGAFLLGAADLSPLGLRSAFAEGEAGLTKFTETLPVPPVIDATAGGTFAL